MITDLFRAEGITVLIIQGMHFEHGRRFLLAGGVDDTNGWVGGSFAGTSGERVTGR
jgi:hypothetical protein